MKRLILLMFPFFTVAVFGQTKTLELEDLTESTIQIIHNPSTRFITVTDMKPNTWVLIYDSMGRLAFQKNTSNGSIGVSTSFWPAGVYHVVVQDSGSRVSKKFLIM